MLGGMLNLRADKWMRVCAGVGLLALLAAQEKVWPGLVTPPPVEPPTDPASTDPPQERPRPVLPHIVPEAPAPRWPVSGAQRLTDAARDGVVSCGQQHPGVASEAAPPSGADTSWRDLQTYLPDRAGEHSQCDALPSDPSLATHLLRTGPPHA
jgi:hypothetical protein